MIARMKEKRKKGKITVTITIGIACFALVMIMFMQFKIVDQTDITSIENMRESELRTELANWKAKYDEVNEKYEETTNKVEEYKKNKQSNEETAHLVEDELAQGNKLLGKTDVEGTGIEIVLKDIENAEISKINADDLLVIVNALKLAGAEAISINEQRIINMSDIVNINTSNSYNLFIKVNGQRILSPYVIKAIGNQTYLEGELLGNGGYVDELKKIGHDVTIEKVNKLKINKYNNEIKTKYMD